MADPGSMTPGGAPRPTELITVYLVDDHEVVRRGLAGLIAAQPDLSVVGEAGTAGEAFAGIEAARPQVLVLDNRLPDGSGIDLCRDVRSAQPEVRCMILTSYDDNDALFAAVMAGASGYLLKRVRGAAIVSAIRQIALGRSLLDPWVTEQLLARLRDTAGASDAPAGRLTEREREILELIARGLTNREIGAELYLAEKTVKNHVTSLLRKLGVRSRTQAALYGAAHHLY